MGFLCAGDPLDVEFFSGTLHWMYRSLLDAGCDVRLIGRSAVRQTRWKRLKRKIQFKLKGKGVNWKSGQPGRQARLIASDMRRETPDVVFAPIASGMTGRWAFPDVPIVHCTDATPRLLFGYYDRYSGPESAMKFDASHADEQLAVAKAAATVVSSAWARDSMIDHYGASPDAVHVVPLGANVAGVLSAAEIDARPTDGPLRLLFVGAAWDRKGGDFAVGAAEALNQRGIDTVLHIVGSRPPDGRLPACVVDEGWCDKRNPREALRLDALMRRCHVFVLPTRAEAFGIAISEAHAYGMPSVATDTGGVSSVLEAGVTGQLVPLTAEADAWADAIAGLWADKSAYRTVSHAARQRYETALSWPAWGRATAAVLRQVAASNCR